MCVMMFSIFMSHCKSVTILFVPFHFSKHWIIKNASARVKKHLHKVALTIQSLIEKIQKSLKHDSIIFHFCCEDRKITWLR